ncbi:MAG: hypothetical protein EG822_05665 [Deltaproteobacteria bacterium]|nr:hypothetical protein [Deltaproteobacteria bacterium]TLN02698.1 MAG: hypothetical protein FDZ73_10630 [bacterium]
MKCPKCGYNSFEFLNACKKCGVELGSFKKTHRINTVLRPAAAVPTEPAAQAAPPVAPPAAVQQENLHENFDLGFPASPQESVKDEGFTGFSFSDEPALPAEDTSPRADETTEDDFSFGEPEEEEPKASSWDIQFDAADSGMEEYERILEPENIAGDNKQFGEIALNEEDDFGSFGTSDFDFSPESAREDIFGMENELAPPAATEKKPQPNLEDFDKEFEMIFADEEPDDSGKKTS